jgi:ComF family protein
LRLFNAKIHKSDRLLVIFVTFPAKFSVKVPVSANIYYVENIIRYISLLREYLFPAGCAICSGMLLDPEEAWYGLCHQCFSRMEVEDQNRCVSCGRPLISEQERCLPCRELSLAGGPAGGLADASGGASIGGPAGGLAGGRAGDSPGGEGAPGEAAVTGGFAFDGAFVLWPYAGNYRKLLKAYKFKKTLPLGNFFAQKMLDSLPRFLPFTDNPSLIGDFSWVPVPPRPGKIKQSGWDQVDYLAGRLKNLRQPVDACLERLPSQTQKKLDRANRRLNLQGRIRCRRPPPVRVLLFDDVITTGSTLDVCARTLKESGTKEVFALALFYD